MASHWIKSKRIQHRSEHLTQLFRNVVKLVKWLSMPSKMTSIWIQRKFRINYQRQISHLTILKNFYKNWCTYINKTNKITIVRWCAINKINTLKYEPFRWKALKPEGSALPLILNSFEYQTILNTKPSCDIWLAGFYYASHVRTKLLWTPGRQLATFCSQMGKMANFWAINCQISARKCWIDEF